MELLLLSSSRTPAGYLTDYLADIKDFTAGVRRALFVPFAVALQAGDLAACDLIVVGGGNTFQLLRECRMRGFLDTMRERVKRDERLAELARVNPTLPVIGLPEGAWLRVSDSTLELRGPYPAVLFTGENPARKLMPGTLPPNFGDKA